jgi:hypothetical protein
MALRRSQTMPLRSALHVSWKTMRVGHRLEGRGEEVMVESTGGEEREMSGNTFPGKPKIPAQGQLT